jgi:hypothetical protein
VLRPYVPNQTVLVRFYRGGKEIHHRTERVKPVKGGRVGEFLTPYRSSREGRITIGAVHRKTALLATVRAAKEHVLVVKPVAGSSGLVLRLLQRGLA